MFNRQIKECLKIGFFYWVRNEHTVDKLFSVLVHCFHYCLINVTDLLYSFSCSIFSSTYDRNASNICRIKLSLTALVNMDIFHARIFLVDTIEMTQIFVQ